jgi:hypothetical protein
VAIARQTFGSRDFTPMPVLADTLVDAGCTDAELLGHLRGPGPHVRGAGRWIWCWGRAEVAGILQ